MKTVKLDELGLKPCTRKKLCRLGITTTEQLLASTDYSLLICSGFGRRSLIDVHRKLHAVGIYISCYSKSHRPDWALED